MDHFWDSVAQTHVRELGGEGVLQEREKQGGLQAAVPFRSGAKGSAACRISQNDGEAEAPGTLELLGHFVVPASGTVSAVLRTKVGWVDGQHG